MPGHTDARLERFIMSTHTSPPRTDRQTQWLWLVIAILGVAVLGMGWAVLSLRKAPEQAAPAISAAPASPAPAASAPPVAPQVATNPPAQTPSPAKPVLSAKTPAPVTAPVRASPPTAVTPPAATPIPQAAAPVPAKEVCLNCATVVAVTPLERGVEPSGAGAVAGGVLGALVGQQFGGGSGKTAATIIGAVGGGMAGNEIEKKMKKEVVYQVQVRMDDGSSRSFEQTQPASVGARVRVEGQALLPLNSN